LAVPAFHKNAENRHKWWQKDEPSKQLCWFPLFWMNNRIQNFLSKTIVLFEFVLLILGI
jgi:hypothetical protein